MKKNILTFISLCLLLFFSAASYAQDIVYNDQVDDEALSRKEAEAQKNNPPGTSDPYYEKHLKNEWEKKQNKRADQLIKEIKKEYKTDKFNKSALDKDPVKSENKGEWPDLYATPPPDANYENDMKNSWEKSHNETKKEVVDWLKKEIEGEKGDGAVQSSPSSGSSSSDPYYDKEIKNSWERDRKDLIDRVQKKLKKDKAYTTVEEEKKAAEEKKKGSGK